MTGHRCPCECAAAHAHRQLWDRLGGLWVLAAFVGSCTLWSLVIPASVGPWLWIPILATFGVLTAGPVFAYRWLVRLHAARQVPVPLVTPKVPQ